MKKEIEIWDDIPEYVGLYKASSFGRIKSIPRLSNRRIKSAYIMAQHLHSEGYLVVSLCNGIIEKKCRVHRLIASTFINKPIGKNFVNHKNGIKTDNNINNLEWCTHLENVRHSIRIGLFKKSTKKEGDSF